MEQVYFHWRFAQPFLDQYFKTGKNIVADAKSRRSHYTTYCSQLVAPRD